MNSAVSIRIFAAVTFLSAFFTAATVLGDSASRESLVQSSDYHTSSYVTSLLNSSVRRLGLHGTCKFKSCSQRQLKQWGIILEDGGFRTRGRFNDFEYKCDGFAHKSSCKRLWWKVLDTCTLIRDCKKEKWVIEGWFCRNVLMKGSITRKGKYSGIDCSKI